MERLSNYNDLLFSQKMRKIELEKIIKYEKEELIEKHKKQLELLEKDYRTSRFDLQLNLKKELSELYQKFNKKSNDLKKQHFYVDHNRRNKRVEKDVDSEISKEKLKEATTIQSKKKLINEYVSSIKRANLTKIDKNSL